MFGIFRFICQYILFLQIKMLRLGIYLEYRVKIYYKNKYSVIVIMYQIVNRDEVDWFLIEKGFFFEFLGIGIKFIKWQLFFVFQL